MNSPKVSVLITAYDREKLLGVAVESALASTLTDIEVIIVDDCSSDDTWSVARSYAERDPRVRAFRNDSNLGDNRNRNRAASFATGDYLKYLDSDDLVYPYSLQVYVTAMDAFPEAGFGLGELPDDARPCPVCLSPAEAYREHFFQSDLFGRAPGSSVIRRSAFEAVGGFREFTGRGALGDLELWLKLARRFHLVKLPRDLVWDRQHKAQERSYQQRDPFTRVRTDRELQREALDSSDCPLTSAERQLALRRMRETDARQVFRHAIAGGGLLEAYRYRNAAAVPMSEILRAVVRRRITTSEPG